MKITIDIPDEWVDVTYMSKHGWYSACVIMQSKGVGNGLTKELAVAKAIKEAIELGYELHTPLSSHLK